ncbi:MAG TPA: hypothetical protein VLE27_14655 [Thermoanaerobaculia bacterium]|nr:hypothetical protein [Thermoanaerobaculia bacterium]
METIAGGIERVLARLAAWVLPQDRSTPARPDNKCGMGIDPNGCPPPPPMPACSSGECG